MKHIIYFLRTTLKRVKSVISDSDIGEFKRVFIDEVIDEDYCGNKKKFLIDLFKSLILVIILLISFYVIYISLFICFN